MQCNNYRSNGRFPRDYPVQAEMWTRHAHWEVCERRNYNKSELSRFARPTAGIQNPSPEIPTNKKTKVAPLQTKPKKGPKRKVHDFCPFFCEFWCFSLGKQARFTSRTFVPECPREKFMNWPFFGLVCRGHSWKKTKKSPRTRPQIPQKIKKYFCRSWFSGRGWGQQLFTFQSPAVHWMAQTSSLNCLSCRNPYQAPHSLNCLPPFQTPFFSLKSASSHPLPQNRLWFWVLSKYCFACGSLMRCHPRG